MIRFARELFYSLAFMLPSSSLFAIDPPREGSVRIATFNMALNRKAPGELLKGLEAGDAQAKKIAAIVQWVSPDLLLANEVDYDGGKSATLLREEYLNNESILTKRHRPHQPYLYQFVAPVNTGVPSGVDLNTDGTTDGPDDAWGYGAFPGQYGMVIFSRYPIQTEAVMTYQKFLWRDLPDALRPGVGDRNTDAWKPHYADDVWNQLRLSSKSHWLVPVSIGSKRIQILAAHPTPPVFDGPEDRNGCRNHDEIRFLHDIAANADYLVDDLGRSGGATASDPFVILGDLNADPTDGSGTASAIQQLLGSPLIQSEFVPSSRGGAEASSIQKRANVGQKGNPQYDTGDFNDREPGNLRVDFVLPSRSLRITGGGVFWPTVEEMKSLEVDIKDASDHHLVWLDVQLP
ncbi:endonuclease/exonuclease/phosphatase family protein [Pirellulaceae bacterium SH467]